MPFQIQVTIKPEQLPAVTEEIMKKTEEFIATWRYELMRQFERESQYDAHVLTAERLPSMGASYYDAIQWRNIEESPTLLFSQLYNDHPWALAVEGGTRPHRIPSKGFRPMKATPVLSERGGKERKYGIPYSNKVIYGSRFNHPGARAFRIFRDTFRRIVRKKRDLVKKAFWAAGGIW